MSKFNINYITGKQGQQGTVLAGVTTVSSTGSMRIPSGPTEQRGGRGRAVFGGGQTPTDINTLNYSTIASAGNASDFGDLVQTGNLIASGVANSTRGVFAGGAPAGTISTIQYVTISSQGGASHFGSLSVARDGASGLSDSTRGVIASGKSTNSPALTGTNVIDYITIASTGDASDFGDITYTGGYYPMCCASPTRGIIAGGRAAHGQDNVIDYITIQSKGNGIKFGELTTHEGGAGCSNSTRGIFAGGYTHPSIVNIITYITISTFGNDTDFGDLTAVRRGLAATNSSTRAIFMGGQTPTVVNTMDYITIASTGNAADFGDMTTAAKNIGACSDVQGGLG